MSRTKEALMQKEQDEMNGKPVAPSYGGSLVNMRREELKEIVKALRRPIPKELISEMEMGGAKVSFISWTTALDILDSVVPDASIQVTKQFQLADYEVIYVSIGILGVEREGVGVALRSKKGMRGFAQEGAYAKAIKRTCVNWGIGRELYQEDDDFAIISNSRDPIHQGLVAAIEALCKKLGLPSDKFYANLFKNYGANSLLEVSSKDLEIIQGNLEQALEAKQANK